ncbi:cell wall protein RBR3 isoform X1 [Cinnamomum micranthum f. kanehirae]|uniref:Small ribosomal subunit protein uS15c n=1 Tax=Cinnamomum micranthum f. kanehirae TaxID=337451 RepID=A0A3S3P9L0_9MAGN|nr:cell wall protein RBR3 isoform X1 [Cinnamomum micranthum f. kanehirae]
MAMPLRLSRCSRTTLASPRLSRFSSSSSSSSSDGGGGGGGENDKNPPPPPSPFSYSSYLSDVKASLRQSPPSPPRKPPTYGYASPVQPSLLSPKPSKIESFNEIQKNLSEFRRRSAAPSQGPSSPPPVSFKDIYNSKLIGKPAEDDAADTKTTSFDSIRESLRQLRSSNPPSPMNRSRGSETLSPYSLKSFKNSLNLKPHPEGSGTSAPLLGGPDSQLPSSIFGREMREKREPESPALKTEFVKMYSYGELGQKLKMLRPAAATEGKKDWFSLGELNERLMKLREMEEKETDLRIGGVSFKDLRDSLLTLRKSSDESSKKSNMQRLAIIGKLGGQVIPDFMLSPPKDHLVEKYFHPDNMSSEEKLKLELKRVRDEFKMSESDCGSSRVQVAQLTTKIKHLSSVLHKKDKHSRKGLQEMVQRRKKLLKYLRRTDWDSYCFVLSKLGLRDNPDYKN